MKPFFVSPNEYELNASLPFGDKSITHRAVMLSSVCGGPLKILNANISADTKATMDCMRTLGAEISVDGTTVFVTPIKSPPVNAVLYCKNSGTTARLLAGLVCGLGVNATFFGDVSLSKRPMPMIEPLSAMGAKITAGGKGLFSLESACLKGIKFIPPYPSAQLKSSVLLAGLYAEGATTVIEPVATRRHTEQMLGQMHADIGFSGNSVTVKKSKLAGPEAITVPNDFSLAAFLLPLGLKRGLKIKNVNLSKERTGFLKVLKNAGADITADITDAESQTGDLNVRPGEISPLYADENTVPDMIDEVIIACVTACLAKGKSVFRGVSGLRHKESDRILSTLKMLSGLGCKAEAESGVITVYGDGKIRGGAVETFSDHRIAMAGVVAGLLSEKGATIDDVGSIGVSSENFLQILGLKK